MKRTPDAPGRCPMCGGELKITGLACEECRTQLTGRFNPCMFCRLTDEQKRFTAVFLDCRGNIREVERELGISYPTVRNRLEEVRAALGFSPRDSEERVPNRREVLESLRQGDISPRDALKLLGDDQRKR